MANCYICGKQLKFFESADQTYHGYLSELKKEETHLLSQSESHSPKGRKGGS